MELVDLFGYVWFALEYSERRGGVARFDPASRRWEQLAPADPDGAGSALERLIVRSLLEVDGAIWIGAESGVFRYEDGAVTAHRSTGNVVIRQVTGLALDAAKRVWISSPTFYGAYYFDGRWVEFRGERESRRFSETPVRHIITDRKGRLWFLPVETPGTSHEIYRFRFLIGNVPHLDRFELSQGTVNDMVHAQSGDYWAATDRGLVRLQLENRDRDLSVKRVYDAGNGLRSSRVWAVAESPVDRSIWVCYRDSGVSRIRGDRIDHFDESNGLESPVVWSIESAVIDEGANLWFGTDRGVSRYDGECWYHYSVAGLEPQMSQVLALVPSSSREDTVLVGTSGNGVFRFHQDDYRRPKFISTDFARRVQGSNLLRFAWDARDLKDVTPPDRLLFRHRVDGGPWSDFSSSRSVDLRLDPGEHTFEVQVRDLDGNANRLPLFQKFNVQAPRWAGPWLTVVVSAAGTALVILVALLAGRFLRRSFNPALSFRGAFRGLELPVVIVDPGGKVVDFNGVGAGLLGLEGMPRRRVSGVSILVVPLLRENAVRSAISSALEGRPTRCLQRVDDGSAERIVVVRAVPLRARRGDIVGAAVLVGDETREELERERGEFHVRMSAVRELAENIHHRLEDSLDEVRREITRLGSRAGDEDVIDGIRSRTEHVEELTRALGLFAGVVAPGQREEVSAPDLVEGVLHPSENGGLSIPEHVTVDLRGQPGLWKIAVDVDSVRQALREVLLNAIDAMPRGGRITIRMANQQRETNEGGAPAGRFVEISIADAGAGIDRTQVMRAFDPLYSTKPRTRHRGVGLSVAYGIVRSHGGDIRVESRKDAGTRVAIYLPAV